MAESKIAGFTGSAGLKLPAILQEGAITYNAKVHGGDSYWDSGITLASQLSKGDWVVFDTDTGNTFDATGGIPVVKPIANGTLILGQIITEPEWVVMPTASSSVRATILSNKWYRVATVEWFGLVGAAKAKFTGANAAAVVPGVAGTLIIDASDSVALAGGAVTLAVSDVASGGAGIVPMHYVAQGTATLSILVGFPGGTTVIQA
jgi:hypothetical protein